MSDDVVRISLKNFVASLNDEQLEKLKKLMEEEIIERQIKKRLEQNIDEAIKLANGGRL